MEVPLSFYALEAFKEPVFLNRGREVELFADHHIKLMENPQYFHVLGFEGIGGIGKSSLLSYLFGSAELARAGAVAARVDLRLERIGTENVLRKIRSSFKAAPCILFDFAFTLYQEVSGRIIFEERRLEEPWIVETLEAAANLVNIALPASLAKSSWRKIQREYKKLRWYAAEDIIAIQRLAKDPAALYERLPAYLGQDLRLWISKTRRPAVIFYDSYESQSPDTIDLEAPWLQSFLKSLKCGMHVVFGRDLFTWSSGFLDGSISKFKIAKLPTRDSEILLRYYLPEASDDLIQNLAVNTEGIPLFISLLAAHGSRGLPVQQHVTNVGLRVVKNFVDHLPADERSAVLAMSIAYFFNNEIFDHLCEKLRLKVPRSDFQTFSELPFVEPVLETGFFKVHDEIARLTLRHVDDDLRRLVTHEYSNLLVRSVFLKSDPHRILLMVEASVRQMTENNPPQRDILDALIDSCLTLFDWGFWLELEKLMKGQSVQSYELAIAMKFIRGICLRRTHNLLKSAKALDDVAQHSTSLGRHEFSLRLERAYVHELLGEYDKARLHFSSLYCEINDFDPTNRSHVKSLLWYMDVLVMDGSFRSALALYQEKEDALQLTSQGWAELTRLAGHAYRFSWAPTYAVRQYENILNVRDLQPSLRARLLTNLAESYCLFDYHNALRVGEEALQENERLCNKIELGKIRLCFAISYAGLGQVKRSRDEVDASLRIFGEVGYEAGVLWSLLGDLIVGLAAGIRKAFLREKVPAIRQQFQKLNTYYHLELWLDVLVEEYAGTMWNQHPVEWLDEVAARELARSALKGITGGRLL